MGTLERKRGEGNFKIHLNPSPPQSVADRLFQKRNLSQFPPLIKWFFPFAKGS